MAAPSKSKRQLEARETAARIREARVTIVLISAMIVLVLLGFARIYTVQQNLQSQQKRACALRRAGRANTNTHERVPLRAALNYLGDLGAEQTDPKHHAAAAAFGARFHAYAASVQPLPNPKC